MYAKLVTKATTVSANVYYNTLMDVITGVITSSSSLDSGLFDTSSSNIINTVPTTWSTFDSAANTGAVILSGCMPRVIRSPWSDSASNYKYVHTQQVNSTNTTILIDFLHAEGWNSTTNTGNNILFAPRTASATTYFWYNPINLTNPTAGFVTIVSASDTHLFVWTSQDLIGTFGGYNFLSEYTRDDPYNTVSNGYPSWFMEGGNKIAPGYSGNTTSSHSGTITRVYNPATNSDNNHRSMMDTGIYRWGMLTPLHRIDQVTGGPAQIAGGLATVGSSNYFYYNNQYFRDANKNPAIPLAEIRIATIDNNQAACAYGSVSQKSPYIYVTKSGWQSLDEIDIGGYRYTNLQCNQNGNASYGSTILLKQV